MSTLHPVLDFERAEDDAEPPRDGGKKRLRARLRRREKLQRVADAAIEQWLESEDPLPRLPIPHPAPPLMRRLPRPPRLASSAGRQSGLVAPRRAEVFTPRFLRTAWRIFAWLYGAARFFGGQLLDSLLRRRDETRSAVRLRETFESLGTTFIKFGQQLSMRLDLLPFSYCRELESMFDNVPEMPYEEAVRIIERATKKPLKETFAAFDKDPIGSASIACVYHAVLLTGEHVAVKVRRPDIGNGLAADMRALGWILGFAELAFLRPGFTSNFLFELSSMLMEELDFIREARFAELFRRRMRKTPQFGFATAPRVYFEHSSSDVLVSEYVTGVWMSEILTAIETPNLDALKQLKEMNIDPVILARRIQMIARYNNFENIFFHADLHPANILVGPSNKITLIDFGSCGSFSRRELISWRRWFDAQSTDDVGGMAQAALAIIEPVPPSIDKDEFAMRLEQMFWNDLYAIKSKHSDWSERISARLWIGFLRLSRDFNVPMRLNTLRMIRASMLADTIAGRLDHDMDPYQEFRHYDKGAGRRAHKRVQKQLRRLCSPAKWVRVEQGLDSALKLVYQVQRTLDSFASIRILPLIGKLANAVVEVVRGVLVAAAIAFMWASVISISRALDTSFHESILTIVWRDVLSNSRYWFLVLLPVVGIHGRRINSRVQDREYRKPQ